MGWPSAVVERVLGEPGLHQVDEALVLERVGRAGGDLGDVGRAVLVGRTPGRDRADRADDEVDRDHVDGPLGDAGELLAAGRGRRR